MILIISTVAFAISLVTLVFLEIKNFKNYKKILRKWADSRILAFKFYIELQDLKKQNQERENRKQTDFQEKENRKKLLYSWFLTREHEIC